MSDISPSDKLYNHQLPGMKAVFQAAEAIVQESEPSPDRDAWVMVPATRIAELQAGLDLFNGA